MENFQIGLASDLTALQEIATEFQANTAALPSHRWNAVQFLDDDCELCEGPYSGAPIVLKPLAGHEYQLLGQIGAWYALKKPDVNESESESLVWVNAARFGRSMRWLAVKNLITPITGFVSSTVDRISNSMVDYIIEMQKRYATSPVRLKGFSVTVGTSVSVEVSFEFQEPG